MGYPQGQGKVIFWDFDGTLAHRPEMWGGTLAAILHEHDPTRGITREQISPFLSRGFPWHTPEIAHPELCAPDRWWGCIEDILHGACLGVGVEEETARVLAHRFRQRYLSLEGWIVYDDTRPTMTRLAERGWRHVVVSNHVPELVTLVEALGLSSLIDRVINSAVVGYEKPHPEIYRIAREIAGQPEVAWMVGDNVTADVLGAESAGIPAILVRGRDVRAHRRCDDLHGVITFIDADDK
jgi:putative hydrolase of the HAD superfamily